MQKQDLVGAWREVGREFVGADGRVTADIPRTSQIMYTPDGYVGVINTPAQRKKVSGAAPKLNLDNATEAERAEAARDVVAYAGHYEIDGELVKHHLYTALHPNLAGTTQVRHATITGDDLFLSALPGADGSFFRIHWRRASKV
jgi:Lipocalin-like domain